MYTYSILIFEQFISSVILSKIRSFKYNSNNKYKLHAYNHLLLHIFAICLALVEYGLIKLFFHTDHNFNIFSLMNLIILIFVLIMHSVDFVLHETKTDPSNYADWNIFKNTHHYERGTLIILIFNLLLSKQNIASKWNLNLPPFMFNLLFHFMANDYFHVCDRQYTDTYDRQWYYFDNYDTIMSNYINFIFVEISLILTREYIDSKHPFIISILYFMIFIHGSLWSKN